MEIKATLSPGQNGTKQLLKEYGDQLVCVRYRYDKTEGKRYKTVELIVDEQNWQPGVSLKPDQKVHIRIGYGERELRERVKAAGGFWDAEKRAWFVSYSWVVCMGLDQRLVDGELPF